jgi:hypothetical protein
MVSWISALTLSMAIELVIAAAEKDEYDDNNPPAAVISKPHSDFPPLSFLLISVPWL